MDYQALFTKIGLEGEFLKNLLKNETNCKNLSSVISEANCHETGCKKETGSLLLALSTKLKPSSVHNRKLIAAYIGNGKIASTTQLEAALSFVHKNEREAAIDVSAFERAAGVGVVVTEEDVKKLVQSVISTVEEELKRERYLFNFNTLFANARSASPFADGGKVKQEFDKVILALLGPKNAEDEAKAASAKKKKQPTAAPAAAAAAVATENSSANNNNAAATTAVDNGAADDEELKGVGATFAARGAELHFSRPEENTLNPKELLEHHLKITGGAVMTRFPPEPNGYLHIGHAKAISLDFGFAERDKNGKCYMRFDDTNPDSEKVEYMDSIIDDVKWLGHHAWKTTYSSDYFDELYNLAVKLIKIGKAFVCHETREETKINREKGIDSKWRNRSVEENLYLFERMKNGCYAEGEATLRMKQNMQHPNTTMRDFVAYRIKYKPHPHVGDKWCIYPSYDYTHCLVDSLENITHSLCTLEFAVRQEPYYWLLDVLKMWKPVVWEYGRLNITYTVMSKRKLTKLVQEGHVRAWSDPRLPTICGMRRRGYSAQAVNHFCNLIGVTRTEGTTCDYQLLEATVRQDLDVRAPRRFAIQTPLKIVITNFDEIKSSTPNLLTVTLPDFPKDISAGSRTLTLSKTMYIDASDFRKSDSKEFYGLAPGKEVLLKYAFLIKCNEVIEHGNQLKELHVTMDVSNSRKPKGTIQWLPEIDCVKSVELRLYNELFLSPDPTVHGDDWMKDLNPNSLEIVSGAMVEPILKSNGKVGDVFQFERLGFFCIDQDTSADKHLVFNRTIPLKEKEKKKATQ